MRERNEEFMANGKEYDVMGYWDCPVCQTKKIKGTLRDLSLIHISEPTRPY